MHRDADVGRVDRPQEAAAAADRVGRSGEGIPAVEWVTKMLRQDRMLVPKGNPTIF